ncbi:g12679 [Coccomyxa viridis]|uniref:G12679 protein n=1 Tax=Coccomyxa viridis TaxID=1274662 RepID=A0ABP1GDL3_9CHLO
MLRTSRAAQQAHSRSQRANVLSQKRNQITEASSLAAQDELTSDSCGPSSQHVQQHHLVQRSGPAAAKQPPSAQGDPLSYETATPIRAVALPLSAKENVHPDSPQVRIPQYAAPVAMLQYTAPKQVLQHTGPGVMPQYTAPGVMPHAAPYLVPQHTGLGVMPQYTAPGVMPHAAPYLMPQYAGPGLIPQYTAPGVMPQYTAPYLMPQHAPGIMPQHTAPGAMSQYTAPNLMPQHAGPGIMPEYTAPYLMPQHAGLGVMPQYTAPGAMSQYTAPNLMPQHIGACPMYYVPAEAIARTPVTGQLGSWAVMPSSSGDASSGLSPCTPAQSGSYMRPATLWHNHPLEVQNADEAWLYGVLNLDGSCDAAGYIVSGALPTNFMSTAAHGHSARPEQLPSSCAAQRAPSQGSKEVPHPKPPRGKPLRKPDWRTGSPRKAQFWLMYRKVIVCQ